MLKHLVAFSSPFSVASPWSYYWQPYLWPFTWKVSIFIENPDWKWKKFQFSVIHRISEDYDLDFFALYACVGLWSQFFVILYANTELSNIMRFATRSTEEIFSLFIAVAFVVEAFKAIHLSKFFRFHFWTSAANGKLFQISQNVTTRDPATYFRVINRAWPAISPLFIPEMPPLALALTACSRKSWLQASEAYYAIMVPI